MLSSQHRHAQDGRSIDTHTGRGGGRDTGPKTTTAISIILLHVLVMGIISGTIDYLSTSFIFMKLSEKHSESFLLKFGSYSITVLSLLLYPCSDS